MPDASLAELALQFAPWYIESVSHDDDDDIYIYYAYRCDMQWHYVAMTFNDDQFV